MESWGVLSEVAVVSRTCFVMANTPSVYYSAFILPKYTCINT